MSDISNQETLIELHVGLDTSCWPSAGEVLVGGINTKMNKSSGVNLGETCLFGGIIA